MNLLRDLPDALVREVAERLAISGSVRIERIVSHGQASPDGFWYDQDETEFVLVLTGAARLRFADDDRPLELTPGDWVEIASHRRHRVDWTATDQPTVWLAVFYRAGPSPPPSPRGRGEREEPARSVGG
jgi:cupin 2 domain-containing protein